MNLDLGFDLVKYRGKERNDLIYAGSLSWIGNW